MRSSLSRFNRPVRIALVAAVLGAVPIAWACGPYLPNWLLGRDELVFEGPWGRFADELPRLWGAGKAPVFKAVESGADLEPTAQARTAQADLDDLTEALAGNPGLLSIQRDAILRNFKEHQAARPAGPWTDLERLLHGVQAKSGRQPAAPARGLPPEFFEYQEGALAYHDLRLDAAVRAWTRLLGRPAADRHYRSTWAAFMLGKAHLRTSPDASVSWFRRTRELAGEGFADRLGLAVSSLGWEAWAENAQGNADRALVLYSEQAKAGDPSGLVSLRLLCPRVLAGGSKTLARAARNPEARAILTAFLVSHPSEHAGDWQAALEEAGVTGAAGADRLAWAAYLAGNFEGAAAWLGQLDPAVRPSPIAQWVRARLLLRDGKLDEARKLLDEAARGLPSLGLDMEGAFYISWETAEIQPAPQRAEGEAAAIQVSQASQGDDFAGALDKFLKAGYWIDAAYLAERVLSTQELTAYIDANWPAGAAAGYRPLPPDGDDWEPLLVGGYTEPARNRLASEIRELLGRRLAREGRLDEAAAYLPAWLQPSLKALAVHLAAGRDRQRPAAERGRELFQAACVLRGQGMAVTGTEVEPDWSVVDGEYDLANYEPHREDRLANRILPVTADEHARLERNRLRPWRRFHYRQRAADLAWEAARLLPAGDEKAAVLATAGSWIAGREPRDADRFYKELVRCCGDTDLGREADQRHWFPEADACGVNGEAK